MIVEQLAAQHLDQPRARAQDFEIAGDLGDQPAQFLGDLVALESGQALQAQIEDRARLLVGQPVGAVGGDLAARLADQRDKRRDIGGRPGAPTSPARAVGRIGRGADQGDDLVDIGDRDRQADQDMRPLPRLVEEIGWCAG